MLDDGNRNMFNSASHSQLTSLLFKHHICDLYCTCCWRLGGWSAGWTSLGSGASELDNVQYLHFFVSLCLRQSSLIYQFYTQSSDRGLWECRRVTNNKNEAQTGLWPDSPAGRAANATGRGFTLIQTLLMCLRATDWLPKSSILQCVERTDFPSRIILEKSKPSNHHVKHFHSMYIRLGRTKTKQNIATHYVHLNKIHIFWLTVNTKTGRLVFSHIVAAMQLHTKCAA